MGGFILVHGAWHGAWAWEKVVPLLEGKGHEVEVFDLPGHGDDGTPVAKVSLQAYADRVVEALDASSGPSILVGHSMGGAVISQAAESRPDKVSKLVYLTAFLLENGQTLLEVAGADAGIVIPNLEMSGDQSTATIKEDVITEAFYGDCSEDDTRRAKERLVPQPAVAFVTPVEITEGNFGSVPRAYIECTEDRAITINCQREMQARLPCETTMTMETSHSPFLSKPEELARHLDGLASE